jgi:hypothetical protein
MTRKDLLRSLIRHARANGFSFRKWFGSWINSPWTNFDEAVDMLTSGHHYYALLFSHEFAESFWKEGTQISFVVPSATYTRRDGEGKMITVSRKAFTRRTLKPDVWKYHLKEMAATDDPMLYAGRFLGTEESLRGELPSGK